MMSSSSLQSFREYVAQNQNRVSVELGAIEVRIAPWMISDDTAVLELRLYILKTEENKNYRVWFNYGPGDDTTWHDEHLLSTEVVAIDGKEVNRMTYRIDDWRDQKNMNTVRTFLVTSYGRRNEEAVSENPTIPLRYAITATGISTKTEDNTGDWPQWQ